MRKSKKAIAILCALAMVLTVFAIFPAVAGAAVTKSTILGVPNVADNYDSEAVPAGSGTFTRVSTLNIMADDFNVPSGTEFRLILPSGVKWSSSNAYDSVTEVVYDDGNVTYSVGNIKVISRTDTVLDLRLDTELDSDSNDSVNIPLYVKVDGATGPLTVELDPMDSVIVGGVFTFARVSAGDTKTTVDKVNNIGESGDVAPVRIEELAVGSLGSGAHTVTLRLPANFTWGNSVDVATSQKIGGFFSLIIGTQTGVGTRILTIPITVESNNTVRGGVILKGLTINASSSASVGDIVVRVSGDVTREDVLFAKYTSYNVTANADGDPVEIFSGRFDRSSAPEVPTTDEVHELQVLVLEESVSNSFLPNRRTKIEFPSWVKILNVDVDTTAATVIGLPEYETETNRGDNDIEFHVTPTGDTKAKVEFTFYVSVEGNKSGDIVAKVSGVSTGDQSVVLGTAISPVIAEASETKDLRVGLRDQEIGDILITETKDEAIQPGILAVSLREGGFSNTPKVEVIEGDLDIDEIRVVDGVLRIEVKNESTDPSVIKISEGAVTLDRTIPEGVVWANIGGSAVLMNHESAVPGVSPGIPANEGGFDMSRVARVNVGNVVTPAPGEVTATVVFTIGSLDYTVDGKDMTMDVAPYIKDNRTFLPVRYVAQTIGVSENNILWDEATKAVTIFKGTRVVQMTIGSKTLVVNGAQINMDTAPEIKDGRTMLPIRWVAQALDAEITWDAEARTVTVKN